MSAAASPPCVAWWAWREDRLVGGVGAGALAPLVGVACWARWRAGASGRARGEGRWGSFLTCAGRVVGVIAAAGLNAQRAGLQSERAVQAERAGRAGRGERGERERVGGTCAAVREKE
jgi:hypothetical protein